MAHGLISRESQLCMSECGGVEIVQHLVLSFPCFAPLWGLVRSWLDIFVANPFLLQDHFIQFVWSSCGSRVRCSFLELVWLCCMWVLWNEKNNRIFKNKESNIHQLLDKVKSHSFRWMKVNNINVHLNFHKWWSSPFACTGIDLFVFGFALFVAWSVVYFEVFFGTPCANESLRYLYIYSILPCLKKIMQNYVNAEYWDFLFYFYFYESTLSKETFLKKSNVINTLLNTTSVILSYMSFYASQNH